MILVEHQQFREPTLPKFNFFEENAIITGIYTAITIFILYTTAWFISLKYRDASLVNFIWGISLSIQAIIYFFIECSIYKNKFSWELLTFLVLVFAHGIRISFFMLIRDLGKVEDKRFSKLRGSYGVNFWWISYFLVFIPSFIFNVLMGSNIYLFTIRDKSNLSHILYWFGIFTMMAGATLEAFADIQKYVFFGSNSNQHKILDSGLWGISRHPNYLGEIIFWWGVYLVNYSIEIKWAFIPPILLTFTIIFITGIPVIERIMREDHGDRYIDYANKVPILFPLLKANVETHEKIDYNSVSTEKRKSM